MNGLELGDSGMIKRNLVILLAFFPMLYLGVWIHELAHAITCWGVGGSVSKVVVYGCFSGETYCVYPEEFSMLVMYAGGFVAGLFFVLIGEKLHPSFYLCASGSLLYALVEAFHLQDTVLYFTSSLFQFVTLAVIITQILLFSVGRGGADTE